MVGVPRSKGCRICVQRRVKCDQTRPTCNNCKKGNRPCPGYGQDLKFQDEGARLRKRFAGQENQSTPSDHESSVSPPDFTHSRDSTSPPSTSHSVTDLATGSSDWDVVGLDMSVTQRKTFLGLLEGKRDKYLVVDDLTPASQIEIAFDSDMLHFSKPPPLEQLLFDPFRTTGPIPDLVFSPNLQQDQLLSVFKSSIAPGVQRPVDPVMQYHSRWLSHLPPLTGTNNLLDTAVRAVTLVHVGRLNNSERFVNESRPYYGKALRLLNTALMDKKKGLSNETLCATILLSFYEMFASDNNESWVRHAGGASALMKMRGPTRHRHDFDREIFLAYRHTLIIDAFQTDTACFLNEPEWRQVSKDIHDDLRTAGIQRREIFDHGEDFYQSMLPLPEVCADARKARLAYEDGKPYSSQYISNLKERLHKARTDFQNTFALFEAALKKAGFAPTFDISKDPVVSISYNFANVFVGSTYTGYWTCSCVLNLYLQALESDRPDQQKVLYAENREHGLNICRSTAFMLTSSFLGPFFLIFGLRVALNCFENSDGPECDWVLQKLFEIGDRHMGMAKHVPGFQPGMTAQELIAEFRKNHSQREKAEPPSRTGLFSTISEEVAGQHGPAVVGDDALDILEQLELEIAGMDM